MVCKLAMDIDIHKIQQDIKSRNSDVVKEINSVLEYIDEIYSRIDWSVYELLENADNIGSKNVKFELDNGKLLVKNDGLCFTNEDFKRICSVNTPINRNSLIDRSFGFGFKSVFNFSNDVRIFSNKIGIRFFEESGRDLWKIFPHEVEGLDIEGGYQTIFEFILQNKQDSMAKSLFEISVEILIFLKSVECIVIEDLDGGDILTLRKSVREKGEVKIVTINRILNKKVQENFNYVCYSKEFSIPERIRINNCKQTKVVIAIPISKVSDSVSIYRRIYPVTGKKNTGFMLSGDFITTMNFDEIVDNEWNSWLLDSVLDYVNLELK